MLHPFKVTALPSRRPHSSRYSERRRMLSSRSRATPPGEVGGARPTSCMRTRTSRRTREPSDLGYSGCPTDPPGRCSAGRLPHPGQVGHAHGLRHGGGHRAGGVGHAGDGRGGLLGSGAVPHVRPSLDHLRRNPAPQHPRALGRRRRHPAELPRHQRRPAGPGGDHRLALRVVHRGSGGLRYACCRGRAPDGRNGLPRGRRRDDRHDDPEHAGDLRGGRHTGPGRGAGWGGQSGVYSGPGGGGGHHGPVRPCSDDPCRPPTRDHRRPDADLHGHDDDPLLRRA